MSHDVGSYVQDILDNMDAAERFVAGRTVEESGENEMVFYALVRAFEIIGEAAKQVPDDIRSRAPGVNWRGMTGMRDRLIHGYREVNVDAAWSAIHERFPAERPVLRRLLAELDAELDAEAGS